MLPIYLNLPSRREFKHMLPIYFRNEQLGLTRIMCTVFNAPARENVQVRDKPNSGYRPSCWQMKTSNNKTGTVNNANDKGNDVIHVQLNYIDIYAENMNRIPSHSYHSYDYLLDESLFIRTGIYKKVQVTVIVKNNARIKNPSRFTGKRN